LVGEVVTEKVDGRLRATFGAGADLKVDMGTSNSDARDANDESRENQERNQAFHY
jgi:hypothetical protein